MPKEFEDCIAKGGRVRTESLPNHRYRAVCNVGGINYYGEEHKLLTVQEKRRNARLKRQNK